MLISTKTITKDKNKQRKAPYTEKEIAYIEAMVADAIREMCVPTNVKGYAYLRKAIVKGIMDENILNYITGVLYPTIAEEFNTTDVCVEKAISRAIDAAWENGSAEVFYSYLGYTNEDGRKKPTNSQFISAVAEKLRVQINLQK